jgi:hypothetical protein
MKNLIQLVYISRSTFTPSNPTNAIEPNVARILLKSRINNKNNNLVGVLYFGEGCFFQCLQGEETAVDSLYEKLLKDDRHTDLKILTKKPIDCLSFSQWNMKYVPLEKPMRQLLQSHGHDIFDPYQFNDEMTQSTLTLLQGASETTILEFD